MSRVAVRPLPPSTDTEVPAIPSWWRSLAAAEVAVAAVVVWLDLPPSATFPLLVLLVVSLVARRQGLASLGFGRPERPLRLAAIALVAAVGWSVVNLGLVMPLLERVTGQRKDFSGLDGLQGDLGMLLGLLTLSWTLAAVGEELAYRGLLLTRAREVFGSTPVATVMAIVAVSVLFGLAHTEQGLVGVIMTALDGAFWCLLALWSGTLWVPVLAHGFNNTIGLTAFYLVGPIHGWW